MKRIFAAIKIDPGDNLTELHYALKNKLKQDKINWVQLHNMHITLKFFGETPEDRIPEIVESLETVVSRHEPFDLRLNGVGIFGSYYKPKVIWIGIEDSKPVRELGWDVLDSMEKIGFENDRQNFIPHITLGRIRFTKNKSHFNEVIGLFKGLYLQQSRITQIQLIESILSSEGPEYITLNSFEL